MVLVCSAQSFWYVCVVSSLKKGSWRYKVGGGREEGEGSNRFVCVNNAKQEWVGA